MTGVDDRIVSMQFDNASFESKMADTIKSLDRLSKTIELVGAKQGLTQLSSAANNFSGTHMESAVQNISSKFSALGAIGFSVIQGLTQRVLGFVSNIANTFSGDVLAPIITGGRQRALNIEQAQFQFRGLGIDVQAGMKSALDAVKGTAFGLDEAAKIAAQFGASGIKAGDQMTAALRGIAGAAAMTGTSFQEIGDIFAQSAASGKVNTQDLQQFATRGLNAAAAIAKVMGKSEAQVRDMASNGQLDFKTFADAMDKAFGKHATEANQTFSGSLANVHAAMSRLGASFETPKLQQERDLFNALTPVIDNVNAALQPVISAFVDIGRIKTDNIVKTLGALDLKNFTASMVNVGAGIRNIYNDIENFLVPVREAFRDIFPKSSTSELLHISELFKEITAKLKIGGETANEVRSIFRAFFAVISTGVTVVKGIVSVVEALVGALFKASGFDGGGILKFFAKLSDAFTHGNIGRTDAIVAFFKVITDAIKDPEKAIDSLKEKIETLATKFENLFHHGKIPGSDEASNVVGRFGERVQTVTSIVDKIISLFQGGFPAAFDVVKRIFSEMGHYIGTWFSQLGASIAAAMKPSDFNGAVDAVNIGLLGGIVALLNKFVNGGFKINLGNGVISKVEQTLTALTSKLKAMQTEIKADVLLKIAAAIGIITASVLVLSLINSEALTKALVGLTVGMGELLGAMAVLDEISGSAGDVAKLTVLSGALILLSTAVLILSGAIKILSTMSWQDLSKGLVGVAVGLGLLIAAAEVMSTNATGMIAGGIAMNAMAIALNILAGAVKIFATMSWGDLAKGLLSVAVALGIIVVGVNLIPVASTLAAGLAMIPLATGITILAGAVKLFSLMSWADLVKGLVGVAAGLFIIAAAMNLMPLTLPITAVGLILVGIALAEMAGAVLAMGSMDLATLAKGIGAIAATLFILAIATTAMQGTLAGAAAIFVVSSALLTISKVLKTIGELSIAQIVTGLAAIAGVFIVLGLAGLLLEPVIPAILGLGIALTLVGVGFTLFGIGAFLVAKAFEAMAKAGAAGTKALIESITMILEALPGFVTALISSILKMANSFVAASGTLLKLVAILLVQLLDLVIKVAPKLAEALVVVLTHALLLIRAKFPDVVETGFEILVALLKGLRDHIEDVTLFAIDVVVKLADTLGNNAQRIVDAAINLLFAFLNAIGDRTADIVAGGVTLLVKFISGIADNQIKIVQAAGNLISAFLQALGATALQIVSAGADTLIRFLQGISDNTYRIVQKASDIAIAFLNAMGDQAITFARAAADALINFLNGLADAINEKAPELRQAGLNIAGAIINGMTGGLASKAKDVAGSAVDVAKGAVDSVMSHLGINSPSKVFMEIGAGMGEGMALGLDRDTLAQNSAVAHAERIVAAFAETLTAIPDSLAGMDELHPVITPVLDLTKVQEGAKGLNSLISVSSITPDVSLGQARIISTTAELTATQGTEPSSHTPSEIKFEQNIYSPTALATNDIYKNTKSQIAMAKEKLKIS